MLYCEAVMEVIKNSSFPITARNISRKLNIQRRFVVASLMNMKRVDKNLTMSFMTPLNVVKKRPIWFYNN